MRDASGRRPPPCSTSRWEDWLSFRSTRPEHLLRDLGSDAPAPFGVRVPAEIPRGEVASVGRVGFIPRVLGWGAGRRRGCANRLTDGLRITLRAGAVYYISPSDPAALARSIGAGME